MRITNKGTNNTRRLIICFLLFFGLTAGRASAGAMQEVELDDGSVLYGEIVSMEGNVLLMKSDALGTVKIDTSKIRNIRMKPGTGGEGKGVQELRQSLMSDPKTLEMILSLQDDPEVRAILQDPDLMKSLNSGDMEALISDPKFMKLLNNPMIQDILKEALK
jgi:hypothetical protein